MKKFKQISIILVFLGIGIINMFSQTIVKDINPGIEGGVGNKPIFYKGKYYFSAGVSIDNKELWVTDGTAEGTYKFKELIDGAVGGNPEDFHVFQDTLFFTDSKGVYWKSDGTEQGTVQLKTEFIYWTNKTYYFKNGFLDVDNYWIVKKDRSGQIIDTLIKANSFGWPDGDGLDGFSIAFPIELKGNLYFIRNNWHNHEYSLVKTDGTKNGTEMLKDSVLWKSYYHLPSLVRVEDKIVFGAFHPQYGNELYISDGTVEGTKLLKDIDPDTDDSNPRNFFGNGELVLFEANEGVFGKEVWVTDGTTEGTRLLYDFIPGTEGLMDVDYYYLDSLFYINYTADFFTNDDYEKLFVTDGYDYFEKYLIGNLDHHYSINRDLTSISSLYITRRIARSLAPHQVFKLSSSTNIQQIVGIELASDEWLNDSTLIGFHGFTDFGYELATDRVYYNHIPTVNPNFFEKRETLNTSTSDNYFIGEFNKKDNDGDSLIYSANHYMFEIQDGNILRFDRLRSDVFSIDSIEVFVSDGRTSASQYVYFNFIENIPHEVFDDTIYVNDTLPNDYVLAKIKVEDVDNDTFSYYYGYYEDPARQIASIPNSNDVLKVNDEGEILVSDYRYLVPEFIDTVTIKIKVKDDSYVHELDVFYTIIVQDQFTAINNILDLDNRFKIYPNPSNGNLRLTSKILLKDFNINIYSIEGKLIYSKNHDRMPLEIEINETGMFFIEIINDGYYDVSKVIIN